MKGFLEGAAGGGLTLYGPVTQVNLGVESSELRAQALERTVKEYIKPFGSEELFPVERRGTVVFQYQAPLANAEARALEGCLPD